MTQRTSRVARATPRTPAAISGDCECPGHDEPGEYPPTVALIDQLAPIPLLGCAPFRVASPSITIEEARGAALAQVKNILAMNFSRENFKASYEWLKQVDDVLASPEAQPATR